MKKQKTANLRLFFVLRGLRRELLFREAVPFGCGSLAVQVYDKSNILIFYERFLKFLQNIFEFF